MRVWKVISSSESREGESSLEGVEMVSSRLYILNLRDQECVNMLISSLESVDESTFSITTSLFSSQISTSFLPFFFNLGSNGQGRRCRVVGTSNRRNCEGSTVESVGMRCH